MNTKPFIHPDALRIGDKVVLTGFLSEGTEKPGAVQRIGTVTAIYPHFWNIRFSRGYTESWSFENLLRSLNGFPPGSSYTYLPDEELQVIRLN